MPRFDALAEVEAKNTVRLRGVQLLALGVAMALSPFVLGGLIGDSVYGLVLVGLTVVLGLGLSPVVIVAGLVDLFWPRTPTSPGSRLQF
jgi:hypothetical protein